MGLGAISGGQGQMTAAQIRDALQTLGGSDRLDASAIENLPSGGGGLATWQLKTENYTATAGDRLRIDASSGNVVITMPLSPSAIDADIWIQRLDTSPNLVLISTGVNKLNGQSGEDGVFAPSLIQVIEQLSYVDPAIGWLGQFDRLTYQNAPVAGG